MTKPYVKRIWNGNIWIGKIRYIKDNNVFYTFMFATKIQDIGFISIFNCEPDTNFSLNNSKERIDYIFLDENELRMELI